MKASLLEKAKEKASVASRSFWKPEKIGNEIYGIFKGFEIDQFENTRPVLIGEERDEIWLPANAQLIRVLKAARPGDWVYVRYETNGKAKKGRSAPKIYATAIVKKDSDDWEEYITNMGFTPQEVEDLTSLLASSPSEDEDEPPF